MTLRSQHFIRHSDLTNFVNANGILRANILKIEIDSMSGGFAMFWWA